MLPFVLTYSPEDGIFLLWMESGIEDSSTALLVVNEKPVSLGWHSFARSAEPVTRLKKTYRFFQQAFDVTEQSFSFQMTGVQDSLRILGFALIPDKKPQTEIENRLYEKISQAGRYKSDLSLSSLLTEFEKLKTKNPLDPFYGYWYEQLFHLLSAEKLINMKGWEWAMEQTGLGIFPRYYQCVMLLDGILNIDVDNSPLFERALWYRGKILYWLVQEGSGAGSRIQYIKDLSCLKSKYPNDPVLKMYLGEQVPTPALCDTLKPGPDVPDWAYWQYRVLCKMQNIAHWWVNKAQADNGELGGKLGDDVEILRWWSTLLVMGDKTVIKGWKKLADCVWTHPKTYNGYSARPLDVEHAAEYIADSAPQLPLVLDDSIYTNRLKFSADYFDTLWTRFNNNKNRFFRSAWFSSTKVLSEPPRNRDVDYNARAVKAVRYWAWLKNDPRIIQSLHEWSSSWAKVSMQTDKGKPKGLVPVSVRFPDEMVNGEVPDWYSTNMYWGYFNWKHHAGAMVLDQLLFSYMMSKDDFLLQPLNTTLVLLQKYLAKPPINPEYGSEQWAVDVLYSNGFFWNVASQWRLVTDDPRFDDLFLKYGPPFIRYYLTGQEELLVNHLREMDEKLSYNFQMVTSEAMHTDRVYVRGYEDVKAMLTGDLVHESMSPYYILTWENTRSGFTAFVKDFKKDYLRIESYNFLPQQQKPTIRLWNLEPGHYEMVVRANGSEKHQFFQHKAKGTRVALDLLPQLLTEIVIQKQ